MNRLLPVLIFGFFILNTSSVFATSYAVDIVANVPGCGDSILQLGEECDGTNLGGASCETVGFDAGTLSCSSACTFLTNSCSLAPPSSGGGTRTSSRDDNQPLPESNVVVSGFSSPGMNVSLLKDGQKVATVPAKADGSFQITISGLSSGMYLMQVVGIAPGFGVTRSDIFTVQVLKDATTKVSNVVLPPSVVTTQKDDFYEIRGVAYPGATVSLYVQNFLIKSSGVQSDGEYSFLLPIREYAEGSSVYVIATMQGVTGEFKSMETFLPASADAVAPASPSTCVITGDINGDCSVDAVDFFVSRWRYVRDLFSERFDFNKDGTTDLVDFSIMAFYWTG
jgi:hypothetical protein